MPSFENLTLKSGAKMPNLGLGTWLSTVGQVKAAVEIAITNGYRHIDAAHCYENQEEVGEAINNKIKDGTVKREDLFVTTKLWNIYHRPEAVAEGLAACVDPLGIGYVDLVLIHWPTAFEKREGNEMQPENADMSMAVDNDDSAHYLQTWNKMVELSKSDAWSAKIKSIGVSNFNIPQLENLKKNSSSMPAVLQIEGHPFLQQNELSKFCQENEIKITNYSPLGNPSIAHWNEGKDQVIKNGTVAKIAAKYGKSPAQILIKFCLTRGHICIPKSVTEKRIVENFDVFDFELEDADFAKLVDLGTSCEVARYCSPPWGNSKWYPFSKEYTE